MGGGGGIKLDIPIEDSGGIGNIGAVGGGGPPIVNVGCVIEFGVNC